MQCRSLRQWWCSYALYIYIGVTYTTYRYALQSCNVYNIHVGKHYWRIQASIYKYIELIKHTSTQYTDIQLDNIHTSTQYTYIQVHNTHTYKYTIYIHTSTQYTCKYKIHIHTSTKYIYIQVHNTHTYKYKIHIYTCTRQTYIQVRNI